MFARTFVVLITSIFMAPWAARSDDEDARENFKVIVPTLREREREKSDFGLFQAGFAFSK